MPDYKGDNLNADMEAVWETAARNFPAMARAYHEANGLVYRTSEVIYSDSNVRFMTPWRQIRDQLVSILGQSSRNVEDTATALREAMTAYAEQDAAAAEALRRASADLPGDIPELPPTKIAPGVASRIRTRSSRTARSARSGCRTCIPAAPLPPRSCSRRRRRSTTSCTRPTWRPVAW
ncbi:MAG TPA: hypothetical protein VIL37_09570 [Natronosporangium sp.]